MSNGYTVLEQELLDDFLAMVQIDSPSKNERGVADWLTEKFRSLDCEVVEDDAGSKVGGNAGNLRVYLKGNTDADPLMFSAHMDTVEPANGVVPVVEDGVVRSKGETILAADDKAGLACIVQLARLAKDQPNVSRPDLEFSIHICEEIGLLGSKSVDTSKFRSKTGFVLDDENIRKVNVGSPGAVRLNYSVYGKAAHAGVAPEKGISALKVAAEVLAKMNFGRIDEETTANVGKIEGGTASNVVTPKVEMKAEARSHNPEKLKAQVDHMNACFESVCKEWQEKNKHLWEGTDEGPLPRWELDQADDYAPVQFSDEDYAVKLPMAAGRSLGWEMGTKISGGGTDGSILTHEGIPCVVLGVGMRDIHSTKENIAVADLNDAAKLCSTVVTVHAAGGVE
jgi:tripeptide aminopeptidase